MPVIESVTVSSFAGVGRATPQRIRRAVATNTARKWTFLLRIKITSCADVEKGITAIILTPTPGGEWNNHENEIPILSARFHLKEVCNGKT
jgi:hypothetical protein